jgi:hypothetical protein
MNLKKVVTLAALLVACVSLSAQTLVSGQISVGSGTQNWQTGQEYLPTTAAPATGGSVYLYSGRFATGATGATITIYDSGTSCNGSPCAIMNAVSIPANTYYSVDFRGYQSVGPIYWSASVANTVSGSINGRF